MGRRYREEAAGKWIQPVRRDYKMACCDCGLVHTMEFRVYNTRMQFRAWRDNRATGQIRRHRKESV